LAKEKNKSKLPKILISKKWACDFYPSPFLLVKNFNKKTLKIA
jgi:hypothetical protein